MTSLESMGRVTCSGLNAKVDSFTHFLTGIKFYKLRETEIQTELKPNISNKRAMAL